MTLFNQLALSKTKRQFLHPELISRHLICSICHDIFEDPMRTSCGHTFCYICIQNWALLQKKCPICKQSTRFRKLQKDLIASQIIDDLRAKCTHKGCQWEGVYSILKKHQRWCEFKPKKKDTPVEGEIVQILEAQDPEAANGVQIVQIIEINCIPDKREDHRIQNINYDSQSDLDL